VAIQTGSTYISDSMTDVTTIPTANLGFSTTASSQKVSTSDYNVERQPKIVIWPPKPEIVIRLELQLIASKFQRRVPPSDCDNDRQPEMVMWPPKPETHISGPMTDRMTIPTAILSIMCFNACLIVPISVCSRYLKRQYGQTLTCVVYFCLLKFIVICLNRIRSNTPVFKNRIRIVELCL